VDIFAAGIIMYEILTMGSHPLYDRERDSSKSYIEKLRKNPIKVCSESFSELAENFFSHLV